MSGLPGVLGEPIRFVLNWGRRYSLWVFNFGLACCAIEFIATSMARHDFIRLGVIPFAPGPRQADLMVVSGTVSDKMAPAVKRLYDQMPEPKYVIFAVDAVYLFPWATLLRLPGFGAATLVEMAVFLGVLAVGLLHAWRRGLVRWV